MGGERCRGVVSKNRSDSTCLMLSSSDRDTTKMEVYMLRAVEASCERGHVMRAESVRRMGHEEERAQCRGRTLLSGYPALSRLTALWMGWAEGESMSGCDTLGSATWALRLVVSQSSILYRDHSCGQPLEHSIITGKMGPNKFGKPTLYHH